MMTKKEELNIIREKTKFIYDNSGIIYTKLHNKLIYIETSNSLQTLLLCDYPISKISNVCIDLANPSNVDSHTPNSYYAAIGVIFEICKQVDNCHLSDDEKRRLRDKLRRYTSKLKIDDTDDLRKNSKFVKIKTR